MTRMLASLAVLLLLPACVATWERPNTTPEQAHAAMRACLDRAAEAVPRQMVRQQASPERVVQTRNCRQVNGREECTTSTTRQPARFEQVDLNYDQRRQWHERCMTSQGYRFVGYR